MYNTKESRHEKIKNYIRQRDLFAVANSVVVAEILAKVQCSDGNKYSIWKVQFINADTFL